MEYIYPYIIYIKYYKPIIHFFSHNLYYKVYRIWGLLLLYKTNVIESITKYVCIHELLKINIGCSKAYTTHSILLVLFVTF